MNKARDLPGMLQGAIPATDVGECIQCGFIFAKSMSRGGYYDICQPCIDGWPPEPSVPAIIVQRVPSNDN